MKTKLHFRTNQYCKNGIFTFLIIFLMTTSSFGQVLNGQFGIEFELCGATITFDAPTITPGQPYEYPIGTAVFQGGSQPNWELVYEGAGTPIISWALKGPTDSNGTGPRSVYYFILESSICSNVIFPSNDLNINCWQEQISCGGLTSITYTPNPNPNPDPDTDGDGVLDSVDCDPLDDSVTTSSANDSDNDGVNDCLDVCPDFDDTVDADGDLVPEGCDCNDNDENVYPGAEEVCDGQDNDCDDPNLPEEDRIDEGIENCDNGVIIEYCNDAKTKILICHNGKDICVSINALDAHEAHGDFLGSCVNARVGVVLAETDPTAYDVVSWPNPSNNSFNVKMITPNTIDKVNLNAFDINGRLIHTNIINGNEDYQFGSQLSSGVYFVRLSQASTTKVIKLIKQ